ncbi:MAG: serine/threonine-protein kinase [Ktedonobacteraceae bacterium]
MQLWRYGHAIEKLGQRYRLIGLLGSGAMADVCLAWDERERREVAIKVIKSDVLDQKTLNCFLNEATQVVRWNHPHILSVYDDMKLQLLDANYGSIVPYIVMEYAKGGDLQRRLIPDQPYPLRETLLILPQLCSAVQYAHGHGVIHRDLKPLNILFRRLPSGFEQIVLSDFGLAVQIDAAHYTFGQAGTLEYMAPEQFRGHVEPASDIFALGVILYQLCTGKIPFQRSFSDLEHPKMQQAPPPLPSRHNPLLPKSLDSVILTALAPEPSRRFTSAMEFWQNVRMALQAPYKMVVPQRKDVPHSSTGSTKLAPFSPLSPSRWPSTASSTNYFSDDYTEPPGKITRIIPITDLREKTTNKIPVSMLSNRVTNKMPVPELHESIGKVTVDVHGETTRASVMRNSMHSSGSIVTERAEIPFNQRQAKIGDSRAFLRRRFEQPFLIVIALLVILLLLVLAVIAADGKVAHFFSAVPSTTIVTITPASKDLQNVYVIDAVMGIPDGSRHQVQARFLSTTSQPATQTVRATGNGQIAGAHATGTLTLHNSSSTAFTLAAGKIFTDAHGVRITNDTAVTVPPASGQTPGKADVSAHVVDVGVSGNISAGDLYQDCCASGITVKNMTAFTGGRNQRTYIYVQQSDIDGATATLEVPLTQSTQASLQSQLAPNERFVSPTQCSPTATSDSRVGARVKNVTVSVTVLCKGEVYDHSAVQKIVTTQLIHEAEANLGNSYTLVGNVIAVVAQAAMINSNEKKNTLLVKAEGVWVFKFSSLWLQRLASLIMGKSKLGATNVLLKQLGVAKIYIQLSGQDSTILPMDPHQIKFVIAHVPGVQEPISPMQRPVPFVRPLVTPTPNK